MTEWIGAQAQRILDILNWILTAELFKFGETAISIQFLVALAFSLFISFFLARALKLWIKRRVLYRLNLDIGTREAASSVIGYLLTVIAFVIVLQTSGIDLSALTIFAGALGVGFGLALQNLVSNFISGITMLIEQPIKVGDYIEVDGLSGTVRKISIRSTLVRTNDGVFVIVPNNQFLENNVINWSYEDSRCRIRIPVDVRDNSNVLSVTEALLACARKESRVLPSPPPKVEFQGFGDGSLKFDLLVWVDDPPKRGGIKSSLYFLIEAEFREWGIEDGVTQMVVDLRSTSPPAMLPASTQQSQLTPQQGNMAVSPNASATKDDAVRHFTMDRTLRQLLRRVGCFSQCSDQDLRYLIEAGYRQVLGEGETICRENDPGDSMYIILSGSVEVLVGSKRVITRHAGEVIGEMAIFMDIPRTATLRTLGETVLFVVDRDNIQHLLAQNQNLADQISEELVKRKEMLENLGIDLDTDTQEESVVLKVREHLGNLFGI